MKIVLVLGFALLLAGCVTDGVGDRLVSVVDGSGAEQVYVCRNGDTVSALYGSQGKAARITVGGVTVQVDPVQAPFGERFKADDGTTFWVNGDDVLLEWTNGTMLFCRESK